MPTPVTHLPAWRPGAESLAQAFDLAPEGILIVVDEVIVSVNAAWLAMHGLNPAEAERVRGLSVRMFHAPPQFDAEVAPVFAQAAKTGRHDGLVMHQHRDGGTFPTWTVVRRLESPDADFVIYARTLDTETVLLDSIVENCPDMIFVKSADTLRFVRFNRAGEALLGYGRNELLGKTDHDVFPPEQAEFFIAHDRAVLAHGGIAEILEEPIETRTKGRRWLHTKKVPILSDTGEPRYLLGISEDITEKKEAAEIREKLAAAQAAIRGRDDFVSVASHELRTPISAALLQVETLLEVGQKPPEHLSDRVLKSLRIVQRAIVRVSQLITKLLDLSRLAAGRADLHREHVDLCACIKGVVGVMTETLAAGTSVTVRAEQPVTGFWDRERIEQVVTNLVENAIKYGDGKPVEVTVEAVGDRARFAVTDHGIGIAPEDQARIFKRFERTRAARGVGGVGLGLWIVHEIVEAHGGAVGVQSQVGVGSTFTVTIPRHAGTGA